LTVTLTVTSVLPGCATIAVVTGLGWLLLQVTVCPVVGFSVGVHAACAGAAAPKSAAAASATAETVDRKLARKRSGALTMYRGANRSDENAAPSIDVSRSGIIAPRVEM
jgi:hypothetical protein